MRWIGPIVAFVVFSLFILICFVHSGEPAWTPTRHDVTDLISKDKLETVTDKLISARTKLLSDQYSSLRKIFTVQAVLIATSLFVLFFVRASTFELKPLGYIIPTKFVRILLPLSLLYVWIEFGFLFNRLIDNRVSLYVLVETLEHATLRPTFDSAHSDKQYLVSANSLARDDYFVDNWFAAFRSEYLLMTRPNDIAILIGVVGFACFHGLAHACMFVLATTHTPVKHGHRQRIMYYVGGLGLCLLAAHAFFRFGSPQVNWEQHICLGSTVAFASALVALRKRLNTTGGSRRTSEQPRLVSSEP